MDLLLRTHNIEVTEAVKEQIHRRFTFALDRFEARIRKVRVDLIDLNGPRQGIDKLCQVTVLLRGLGRVTSKVAAAVARAARLAQVRIAKKIRRKSGHPAGSIRFATETGE
jgi:putative sigma-54 modulation protein